MERTYKAEQREEIWQGQTIHTRVKGGGAMKQAGITLLQRALGITVLASALAGTPNTAVLADETVPDPATNVECGDIIGPNEKVVLDGNVGFCGGTQPAITVIGPATLDLNGYAVACNGDEDDGVEPKNNGILAVGKRATIKNGVVVSCRRGVYLGGSGSHRVEHMGAGSNLYSGFHVHTSRNRVSDSLAVDNGHTGFMVDEGQNNRLTNNKAAQNKENGFYVTKRTTVMNNEAFLNDTGFYVRREATLRKNFAYDNDQAGIVVGKYVKKAKLLSNRVEHNEVGIQIVEGAEKVLVLRNVSAGNALYDLTDENVDCGTNRWRRNTAILYNQACTKK